LSVEARFETAAWPDRLGLILAARPGAAWRDAAMEIRLAAAKGTLHDRWELPKDQAWSSPQWHEVFLAFDPTSWKAGEVGDAVAVQASELPGGTTPPVDFDAARGWHRVSLDGIVPIVPPGGRERQNDAIERVKLVLSNRSDCEQVDLVSWSENVVAINEEN
jgi:hypothetical protein